MIQKLQKRDLLNIVSSATDMLQVLCSIPGIFSNRKKNERKENRKREREENKTPDKNSHPHIDYSRGA